MTSLVHIFNLVMYIHSLYTRKNETSLSSLIIMVIIREKSLHGLIWGSVYIN